MKRSLRIIVNEERFEERFTELIRDLGDQVRATVRTPHLKDISGDTIGTKVLKIESRKMYLDLNIEERTLDKFIELCGKLHKHFPEIKFEDKVIDNLLRVSSYFNGVQVRGVLNTLSDGTFLNYVEMVLQNFESITDINARIEIEAQNIQNPDHKQIIFEINYPLERFLREVIEVWLISDILQLSTFGSFPIRYFHGLRQKVFSYEYYEKMNISKPFTTYSTSDESQIRNYGMDDKFAVKKGYYTRVKQCLQPFFGRDSERRSDLPISIWLYIPEHRGGIKKVYTDAQEDGTLKLKTEVANPLNRELELKLAYIGTEDFAETIPVEDRTLIEKLLTEIPSKIEIDLVEKGHEEDIIDRWEYYFPRKGVLETRVETAPAYSLKIDLDFSITEQLKENLETMSNAYARLFILENTLRDFIKQKLKDKHKTRWVKIIKSILLQGKTKADTRRIEKQISIDPENILNAAYFSDLTRIITEGNLWGNIFKKYFIDKESITVKLKELEKLRNPIAHTNPISKHDVKRIEVYYIDLIEKMQK